MDARKNVSDSCLNKQNELFRLLGNVGSALVAFSGGLDSTYLLYAAKICLGDRVSAFTAETDFVPKTETEAAARVARELGVAHIRRQVYPLSDPHLRLNPPDRCYFCKRMVYEHAAEAARKLGLGAVMDGTTAEDGKSYRPGSRAVDELGIVTPLKAAGLGRAELRELSRNAGLSTWDKPSESCLATRFPYGSTLSIESLRRVEEGESFLKLLGFRGVRLRVHGTLARVEVALSDLSAVTEHAIRPIIVETLRELGFTHVTLDLEGFRSGSMDL